LFDINLIELPEVKQVNEDGTRYYTDGGEKKYPSVTTILGADPEKLKSIAQWRERVGDEEANRISTQAAGRGTRTHALIESYIMNEELPDSMPDAQGYFLAMKNTIDSYVNNIRVVEGKMLSDHLRCAGTVDCIAEYRGEMAIIDWKTSNRMKRKSENAMQGYFKQAAAYAVMFEENTKIPVKKLVIIMSTSNGECQLFVEDRDSWIDKFIEMRDYYESIQ
jgi:genome maintenance exonuclease 1